MAPASRDDPEPPADLAAVVHETTNALTVILGWLERANELAPGEGELQSALGRAVAHARSARDGMRRAIGAKATVGDDVPRPELAADIGGRALEDLGIEARRAGVRLALTTTGAKNARIAEPRTVWQILTNLVLNAIAHSPAGGTVELRVFADPTEVVFSVSDGGAGIAPGEREAIFTRGRSGRQGGAGIGLFHARALARASGGELTLEESAASGSRFALSWPRRDAASGVHPARSVRQGPRLDGRHVLLLEDDAAVIELLELTFVARGAECTTVSTAIELEQALRDGPFDTLLLDLSPFGGRLDVGMVARARALHPDIAIVVISGTAVATPDGVAWLRKPFEPNELVNAILGSKPRP